MASVLCFHLGTGSVLISENPSLELASAGIYTVESGYYLFDSPYDGEREGELYR